MEKNPFLNQLVLITGGSSGIGLATARLLAGRGAHVWLMARRPEALQVALTELESLRNNPQQRFGVIPVDVADAAQVERGMAELLSRAGLPCYLINSAGITHPGFTQDLSLEIYRRLMEVNYFGTVYTIKALLPGMLARGSGYIVNICSMGGLIALFGYTAYSATKFAVRGFTDSLRAELRLCGLQVSLVVPPDTRTPQLEEEEKIRPPEVTALAEGNAPPVPVERVARDIVRGIARRRYLIFSGSGRFWFTLSNLFGTAMYPVEDLMVKLAIREVQRHPEKWRR